MSVDGRAVGTHDADEDHRCAVVRRIDVARQNEGFALGCRLGG
jgi:hypothetical protein